MGVHYYKNTIPVGIFDVVDVVLNIRQENKRINSHKNDIDILANFQHRCVYKQVTGNNLPYYPSVIILSLVQ